MKKFIVFLLISMAILPLYVNAAEVEDGGSVKGTCEKKTDCEEGVCQSVCKVWIEGNTVSLNEFSGTFVYTPEDKGKIVSVTAAEGWTNNTGNSASFMFTATEAITASKFDLATVVLEVEEGVTDCKLTVDSVYGKTEIIVEKEVEVSTGATLPLAILACGVGAVAVIYVVSKKNKKLYKI